MIAPETLPASVQALVERFTAVGIRPVLKHAVTALGVVSTYAMGVDPDPDAGIRVTAGGEAARDEQKDLPGDDDHSQRIVEYERRKKKFFARLCGGIQFEFDRWTNKVTLVDWSKTGREQGQQRIGHGEEGFL